MMAVLITAELATQARARGAGMPLRGGGPTARALRHQASLPSLAHTSLAAATYTPPYDSTPGKGRADSVLGCHPPQWRSGIYQIHVESQAGSSGTVPASCRSTTHQPTVSATEGTLEKMVITVLLRAPSVPGTVFRPLHTLFGSANVTSRE